MKRRETIKGAFTCGIISSLSGCASVREATSFGPAEFDNITVDVPDEVVLYERFDVVISAENTGGERGDFSTTLTIGHDPLTSQETVSIEDIRVGETGTTEREGVFTPRTGELMYRITDHGVEETVYVNTRSVAVGDTLESPMGYHLTVRNPTVHETVATGDTVDDEIYTPEEDSSKFLVVDVEISGPLSEADPRLIGVENGQEINVGFDFDMEQLEEVNTEFDPDTEQNESGQLVFEVPVSEGELQTDLVRRSVSEDQPPALRWEMQGMDAPEFEVSVDSPTEVTVGEPVVTTVNVSNVGKSEGKYRCRLTADDSDFGTPEVIETKAVDLEPGEEKELELSYETSGIDTPDRRLEPSGERISPDIVPIELAFGETFTAHEGVGYTVDSPMNRSGYATEVTYEAVWQEETISAKKDGTIAILDVDVSDTVDNELSSDRFSLLLDDDRIEPLDPSYSTVEYTSPVSGIEYDRHSGEAGGLLLFGAPAEAETESITIRAEFYGEYGAYPIHWNE